MDHFGSAGRSFGVNLEQLETLLQDFWRAAPSNSLHLETGEKAWERPQVAVARGDDPLFVTHKRLVGDFCWTPQEAFSLAFPGHPVRAAELRVISYVLPQTQPTREEQRQASVMPAERWARSRFHGEEFNCELRLHLAEQLTRAGFPALAPERLPGFAYRKSKRFGIASNWSERHAAFIAGHGTFSLSDALITRWGKAVRFGSVVAHIDLPVSERVYGDELHAWCLWYSRGTCGACAQRCPADAISTEKGHDKPACFNYIRETTAPYATQTYGTGATPCGLCQVKIPCEERIPPALSTG
jgi:epoxyqueuosine reductase QueG